MTRAVCSAVVAMALAGAMLSGMATASAQNANSAWSAPYEWTSEKPGVQRNLQDQAHRSRLWREGGYRTNYYTDIIHHHYDEDTQIDEAYNNSSTTIGSQSNIEVDGDNNNVDTEQDSDVGSQNADAQSNTVENPEDSNITTSN